MKSALWVVVFALVSCNPLYENILNGPTGKIEYNKIKKKDHPLAYALTQKYGNCFQMIGMNHDFYWCYYTEGGNNYIHSEVLPHRVQIEERPCCIDSTRIGWYYSKLENMPDPTIKTFEYNKTTDWVYGFDHKKERELSDIAVFNAQFWYFRKEGNKVVGSVLFPYVPAMIEGEYRGISDFMDNLIDDIVEFSLIDEFTLDNYGIIFE